MIKKLFPIVLGLVICSNAFAQTASSGLASEKEAVRKIAESWLLLIDSKKFQDAAAKIPVTDFLKSNLNSRSKLVGDKKITAAMLASEKNKIAEATAKRVFAEAAEVNIDGMPPIFWVIRYRYPTSNGRVFSEFIYLTKDKNNNWSVVDFEIK